MNELQNTLKALRIFACRTLCSGSSLGKTKSASRLGMTKVIEAPCWTTF